MLIPSITLILFLGVYAAYEEIQDFEVKNSVLAQSLGRQISSHLDGAKETLDSLSTSITRYDPFWFQWVLTSFTQAYPDFERLLYIDPTGRIIAASPRSIDLISIQPFTKKVTRESAILSKPTLSPASDQLVLYMGIKLDNDNALIGELSLETFQKHLHELLPDEEGELILCDAYGNLISHPDFNRVMTQDNIGSLSILQESLKDGYYTGIFEEEDVYYLGTASRIQQTDWVLLIFKPIKSIFLPILSPIFALLTIIMCLFFMFAHFLQYRLRESIVRPLAHFTESIELTAQGQYRKIDTEYDSFAELSIIEQEFDQMVQQVNLREREIKENEERFRQLVENIHEVYWIIDVADNQVIYASPSYEIIWGRTRESLYDNPESFFLAITPDDRLEVLESVNALRKEGKILDKEFRIELPDGKERWIRAQSFPVYDEEGVRVRLVGVAEDITDRKAIQNALMAAKQDAEVVSRQVV